MTWPTEEEQQEKINKWNQWYPIGTKVTSDIYPEEKNLITRTEAVLLFKHRLAVYLENYNGYFDLEETRPVNPVPEDTIFVKKEAPAQKTTSDKKSAKTTAQSKTTEVEQQNSVEEKVSSEKPVLNNKAKAEATPDEKPGSKKKVAEPKKTTIKKTPKSTSEKKVSTEKKPVPKKAAAVKTNTKAKTAAKPKKSPPKKSAPTTPKTTAAKKIAQKV